jgi:hypothetical protein
VLNLLRCDIICVPDVEAGHCLGSEGNGVSVGEGGEGRPSPPKRGKDKQSMSSKGRDNMGKDKEDQPSQT